MATRPDWPPQRGTREKPDASFDGLLAEMMRARSFAHAQDPESHRDIHWRRGPYRVRQAS